MADYFPLLSRTIVSLGDSTPDQRATVYRRAREVLAAQLGKVEPPLDAAVIEAEMTSFDEAVHRVEREARRFDPPSMRAPEPEPPPAPPEDETSEPEPEPEPSEAPEPPASAASARRPITVPKAPAPLVPRKPAAPVIRDAEVAKPAREEEPPPPAEPPHPSASARNETVETDPTADTEPGSAANAESEAGEASRPRIERRTNGDLSWVRPIVLGFAIAAVVIGVGVLAFMLRDRPADFEKPSAAPAQEERKIADRLPSDAPAERPAAAGAPGAGAAGAGLPVQVTQRAALFEEPLPGATETRTTQGRAVWRLDTSEADVAVRATVEMSGAIGSIEFRLRRNRDAKFPASHLVEFRFATPENGENGPVRDIGVPEMRQEESVRGSPLAGLPVPVTENVFLMGLTNLPQEIERNRDLLRSRNWILLPIRFANGRRAVLLIEKGPTGDRVVADAFQAWR